MLRLAVRAGFCLGRTPTEALATLTAWDVEVLAAFEEEYGWPDPFFLAAVLGPAVTAPYAKGRAPAGHEFVPYFKPAAQTPAEMLRAFKARLSGRIEAPP